MKRLLFFSVLLMLPFLSAAFFVGASCPGTSGTAADNLIDCSSPSLTPIATVDGRGGNDTIIIGEGVIVGSGISGSVAGGDAVGGGVETGNDTITNDGTITTNIFGDNASGGTGSDTITNNGDVGGSIYGDARTAPTATGNDVIVNNGDVGGSIYGDNTSGSGTGDDTITNNGVVNNNIIAGGGNDTVTINGNTATVGGVIDGGANYDILTFNLSTTSAEELAAWAAQIAAANPAGGTLTFNGHTYTWQNFEELTQLLLSLERMNGIGDPIAVYCALEGGVDIYSIIGEEGLLSLHVTAQAISSGILSAANENLVEIGASADVVVYVTALGELQVNTPGGFSFSFVYETRCGALPAAVEITPTVEPAEEFPAFSIVNQPYGG